MNHPFDFGEGEVTYCSWEIDEFIPLCRQLWELRQDLIQVEYKNRNLIIDVGWYPDFNPEGQFVIQVIKNQDWEQPVLRREAFSVEESKVCVAELVEKIANDT